MLIEILDVAINGGFTYLNPIYKEKEVGEGVVLDVNSLYPSVSVMYDRLIPYGYPVYFENIINKIDKESKGIFVLQAQLTDSKLIFGPYSKEKVDSKHISEIIFSFKDDERLKYLNVIMRDFFNADKCEEIINLNLYKGNTL